MYEPEVNDYVNGLHSWVRYTEGGYISRQNQQHPKEDGSHPRGISQSKWAQKRNPIILTHDNPHRYVHILLCCYESSMVRVEICKEKENRYE